MLEIGLECPTAAIAHSMEEAFQKQPLVGYPTIIRPSFTMGGSGGGIAQIKAKTVDFGGSDAPLKPAELEEHGLLQFPMVVGGVVPVGAGSIGVVEPAGVSAGVPVGEGAGTLTGGPMVGGAGGASGTKT